jgi:hypothetical protein
MPSSDPIWAPSSHTTVNPPPPSRQMDARCWSPVVYVLTGNSSPIGVPALSKRRAKTPAPEPSCASLSHATSKPSPSPQAATGAAFTDVASALTANSSPGCPVASYRRPVTSSPLTKTATKLPSGARHTDENP